MSESQLITIAEACQRLNVSIYVVRRFCDGGYIPHIRRDRRYRRLLTLEQFELLSILVGLEQAGFSKPMIKRYARLARQGEATASERLAILTTRKHQLKQEIEERRAAIDFIERQEELAKEL